MPSCNLSVYDGEGYRMARTRGIQQSEANDVFGDPCLGPDSPHGRRSHEILPHG